MKGRKKARKEALSRAHIPVHAQVLAGLVQAGLGLRKLVDAVLLAGGLKEQAEPQQGRRMRAHACAFNARQFGAG